MTDNTKYLNDDENGNATEEGASGVSKTSVPPETLLGLKQARLKIEDLLTALEASEKTQLPREILFWSFLGKNLQEFKRRKR